MTSTPRWYACCTASLMVDDAVNTQYNVMAEYVIYVLVATQSQVWSKHCINGVDVYIKAKQNEEIGR